ncbi:hypothetical protein KY290_027373 [Solanum tuberosum]|uniref:Putative plant transposon protein domain-containing protein n=1 Tax=Solanum tuberosum TaxID=4113 RepID=A0ABQ7UES4_SOLTU|nr:hypothetical protein KY290_027373 [Solanum tuberosum]
MWRVPSGVEKEKLSGPLVARNQCKNLVKRLWKGMGGNGSNAKEKRNIWGKDVKFSACILNELLGIPNCDPDVFNDLKDKPSYRDIRHTLCGVDSNARWERSKDTGRHNTLHFASFNQVAKVWLKIVCSVFLLAKHLTDVTKDRVVLVYMLMKGMPINVGVILRQNMMSLGII